MSDTPRTDAALVIEGSAAAKAFGFVNADFARQLERETMPERVRKDLERVMDHLVLPHDMLHPEERRAIDRVLAWLHG